MTRYTVVLAVIALTTSSASAEQNQITLPSGLQAELQEMLWDRPGGGLVYRFRFVAPEFTGQEPFETVTLDLEHLCTRFAVPRLADIGPAPSRVVVSLADKPSEFGVFDSQVQQVFESFSLDGDTCILEMF